ncbi:Ankyrin repeat-containing protein [Nannochloropsis gaditana]|uniref:Ankyrin repeat-containing protein n=1 Tax=Nannochloropsis gaditana TaxID=72520 RepID=W7TPY8_9STRA|nr:Ankyrin repeat-containing protein [Nannochloropsis gaditana]
MSVDEIFQLIQCRGSVTQEKKEVDLGRLRVLLSQNKALVHAKGRMDEETPLHVAAAEGVVEAVRLLLQAGASPAAVDKAGYTPLHWAAGKGHEKVVEDLLKHNADANAADKNGLTPLHRAAYWGQTACIKELLYKGGADPNVQDHLQHTPFMMAAWFGKIDSAREIFEKMKSNDIQLPNVWGLTPLEWARQSNRSEVAAFIERRYRKLGLPIERVQPGSSNRSSVPPSPSPSHSAAISPFVGSSTPTTATLGETDGRRGLVVRSSDVDHLTQVPCWIHMWTFTEGHPPRSSLAQHFRSLMSFWRHPGSPVKNERLQATQIFSSWSSHVISNQ